MNNPLKPHSHFLRFFSLEMPTTLVFSLILSFIFISLITLSAAQDGGVGGGTPPSASGGGGAGGGKGVNVELWCVAKNNAEDATLQSALDWACGQGGANCGPIQLGGPCYDPSDIERTASYAFNDYFLKHGLSKDSCSFDNNAALTSLNPSHGSCKFPSSLSVSNGVNTGTVNTGARTPASADFSGNTSITNRSGTNLVLIIIHLLLFTIPVSFLR